MNKVGMTKNVRGSVAELDGGASLPATKTTAKGTRLRAG